MEIDYEGLDPSSSRRLLCRFFEPRYFILRHSTTLGLGLIAILTRSVTITFIFICVLALFISLRTYIWVTSLSLFRKIFRQKRIIITTEGWWFIIFTIGVGVAAINTGVSLLYLVFAMLPSLIVISGILLELSFRKLDVERILPPAVFCSETFEAETVLINRKAIMSTYSVSFEEIPEGEGNLFRMQTVPYAMRVPPNSRASIRYNAVANKRGLLHLKGIVIKSIYPFGFFYKRMAIQCEDKILVYPKIIPLPSNILPPGSEIQHILRRISPLLIGDEDFRGLKEYRDGENPRRIHWALSAKHNKILVREMEKKRAGRILVLLDKRILQKSAKWLDNFEDAVSLAASVLYHANEQGYETALIIPDKNGNRLVEPAQGKQHLYRMLEILAVIEPSINSEPELVDIPGHIVRGSLVYLVSAGKRRTIAETVRNFRQAGCRVRILTPDAITKEEKKDLEVCVS
jgi:uncharacterized protein (DUF58 family)